MRKQPFVSQSCSYRRSIILLIVGSLFDVSRTSPSLRLLKDVVAANAAATERRKAALPRKQKTSASKARKAESTSGKENTVRPELEASTSLLEHQA